MEDGYEQQNTPDQETASPVKRGEPKVDEARKKFVGGWCAKIQAAKKHHESAFKRMRRNMKLARLGAEGEWLDQGNYVSNIIQRHINQQVAQLYARNPKAQAKRRPRLEYQMWDGDPTSLQAAMQTAMPQVDPLSGMMIPGDPMAAMIIQEVQDVRQRQLMYAKIGKTLEILFNYYLQEQVPDFKDSAKQLVRRAKVCGVAYIELNFQRMLERRPEVASQIADFTDRLAHIEALQADIQDGEADPHSAKAEELRVAMEALHQEAQIIVREGVLFDFPRSTEIIPDPCTRSIKGWVGTGWVAVEMHMDRDKVKETYGVDLGEDYTAYTDSSGKPKQTSSGDTGEQKAVVWRVKDKATGTEFTVCDGYCDYLRPPAAPDVKIERFFNLYPLTFNDLESDDEDKDSVFPRSDVDYVADAQEEYNRAREGLREHRKANRPKYATAHGALEDGDKKKLENHAANAVLELASLKPGTKLEDLVQRFQMINIDPNQYDVSPALQDVMRTVGSSEETTFGNAQGDSTATAASIAAQSMSMASSSNVDDLDSLLTQLARDASQVMLLELDPQTVMEIVGPGAVWPELSRAEIVGEVYLEIRAGSSGRPNKAQELANIERGAPFLLQMPELSPKWLGQRFLEALFEDVDIEEAFASGMPSITALNAMAGKAAAAQAGTGDPATDPAAQGGEGGDNAAQPPGQAPGPQPAYPAEGPLQVQ
jgi:hypothetical protein